MSHHEANYHAIGKQTKEERFTTASAQGTLVYIAYCADCDRLYDVRSGCPADIRSNEANKYVTLSHPDRAAGQVRSRDEA